MRRHADSHRILATGHNIVHVGRTRHHHCQRTGPEPFSELIRGLWNLTHPTMQEARAIQVDDDRMVGRPPLGRKNFAHRRRILRIGAQPIDGLGGKSHELTVAQGLHGSVDLNLGRSDNSNHSREFYQPSMNGYG